jgi:hypothetical protein
MPRLLCRNGRRTSSTLVLPLLQMSIPHLNNTNVKQPPSFNRLQSNVRLRSVELHSVRNHQLDIVLYGLDRIVLVRVQLLLYRS